MKLLLYTLVITGLTVNTVVTTVDTTTLGHSSTETPSPNPYDTNPTLNPKSSQSNMAICNTASQTLNMAKSSMSISEKLDATKSPSPSNMTVRKTTSQALSVTKSSTRMSAEQSSITTTEISNTTKSLNKVTTTASQSYMTANKTLLQTFNTTKSSMRVSAEPSQSSITASELQTTTKSLNSVTETASQSYMTMNRTPLQTSNATTSLRPETSNAIKSPNSVNEKASYMTQTLLTVTKLSKRMSAEASTITTSGNLNASELPSQSNANISKCTVTKSLSVSGPTSKNNDDNTILIIYIVFGSVLGLAFLMGIISLIGRCRHEQSTGMFHLPSKENLELSGFSSGSKSHHGGNFYGELQPEPEDNRIRGNPNATGTLNDEIAENSTENGGGFRSSFLSEWHNLPTTEMSEVSHERDTKNAKDNSLFTYGKTGGEDGNDSGDNNPAVCGGAV